MIPDLRGRVAVVTGAAGGIGLALCKRFAAEGMSVVMADVHPARLDGAAATLAAETGADVLAVPTDVSSWAAVEVLAAASVERFGAVHLLCNNAGVTLPGVTWEYSLEEWEWVIGVNLRGVVHGIKAFVPPMLAHREPAHVVNTASLGGLMAFPGLAMYTATKYGVVGLSETLAHDLADRPASIGVSVLCPGPTETDLRSHSRALHPESHDDVDANDYEGVVRIPPADVADQVVEAIRTGRFWILTHPEYDATIEERTRKMLETSAVMPPSIL